MEKKIWTKPEVSVVEFQANEYVTACSRKTSLTHAHNIQSNSYYVFVDANEDNSFSYDAQNAEYWSNQIFNLDPEYYPGFNSNDKAATYNSETYHNFMMGLGSRSVNSDQMLYFSDGESSTKFFTGCGSEDISSMPTPLSYNHAWLVSATDTSIWQRMAIWWDERIHLAYVNASHSG